MNHNPLDTKPKQSRHLWRRILLTILVLVVAWYVGLAIGVYRGYWQGSKTTTVLRYSPLPVLVIGWQPLSYGSYLDQRRATQQFYAATAASGTTAGDPAVVALTKMIRTAASEQLLHTYNITVTAADIEQGYQAQILQNGNQALVVSRIKTLYGWTPEQFKQDVVRPAIIRDKIQEKLSFDTGISAPAQRQASEVMTIVKAGQESFQDIAKKYSDDVYAANSGDLGWVTQGELTKEIDDVAFSIDVNTVSDIIHTKYGFHIIKPLERKTVDGQDQVHLLMITLLAPQVDDRIDAALKQSRVRIFVPHIHWDTAKNAVVAS